MEHNVDRKENKERNFAQSETKHVVRIHEKNAENAIFRTGGVRKKGKPRMRWMDEIKSVTGLSVNDLNQ